jgi:glutathione S-transferase
MLYYHPLASFCWKPLIALYENNTSFEPVIVDLMDEASAAAFRQVWPMARFPVLRDTERGRTVAESTTVIEYLHAFYPGPVSLIPSDPETAWQVRMWDRVYDHYVQEPMQKIVADRLRPEGGRDALGVEQAREQLRQAYAMLERQMDRRTWSVGDGFSLADCAAAPALFYADTVEPFGPAHGRLAAYLGRLVRRPSFARVLKNAEPYFGMFPMDGKPDIDRIRQRSDGK